MACSFLKGRQRPSDSSVTVIPQTCRYRGARYACGLSITCVLAGGKPLDLCSGGMIWACCVDRDTTERPSEIAPVVHNASDRYSHNLFISIEGAYPPPALAQRGGSRQPFSPFNTTDNIPKACNTIPESHVELFNSIRVTYSCDEDRTQPKPLRLTAEPWFTALRPVKRRAVALLDNRTISHSKSSFENYHREAVRTWPMLDVWLNLTFDHLMTSRFDSV
ncbi:hypothetical protein EVAR_61254_1 [Eumeta japonica]|uniref:Uncharacterized protein n=1 Tax=Eumeta variegata TaxID=151549 RepID=A0A4C1Z842_EUMVA|nr:hypothetical protein EVAR_61254_1 [Eumeta japonica]